VKLKFYILNHQINNRGI